MKCQAGRPVLPPSVFVALSLVSCHFSNTAPFTTVGPAAPAKFAVFNRTTLTVTELERAFPAPVTVGSEPSPQTLSSDDPSTLSIGEDGSLTAHKFGATSVHASSGGGLLQVMVQAPGAPQKSKSELSPIPVRLAIGAPRDHIVTGGVVQLALVAESDAVDWSSSDQTVLQPLGRGAFLGVHAGRAQACARQGDASACQLIEVSR